MLLVLALAPRTRIHVWPRQRALAAALLALAGPLLAQGGPPMVTDDPGTPGDGHGEINLGNIGTRTDAQWLIAAPDVDINYGWGERLQLKCDTPWNVTETPTNRATGLGTTLFGVKWRFFDDEASGWTVSTYPQLGLNLDAGSVARGLANPGKSFFLPLESAGHLGPIDLDVELGRNLQQQGPDQWIGGIILAHSFGPGLEAMFETRRQISSPAPTTLLNLGGRWELSKELSLMGAAGRELGTASPERLRLLYYLGVQIRL
jgi:hypothetical protein